MTVFQHLLFDATQELLQARTFESTIIELFESMGLNWKAIFKYHLDIYDALGNSLKNNDNNNLDEWGPDPTCTDNSDLFAILSQSNSTNPLTRPNKKPKYRSYVKVVADENAIEFVEWLNVV